MPSRAEISSSTCQNRFSSLMLVATPCNRTERARLSYSAGSALVNTWHIAHLLVIVAAHQPWRQRCIVPLARLSA